MANKRATQETYRKTALKNGLTLIAVPSKAATAAVVFGTEGGSIFDFSGKEGLAHLLEHMAFKGTQKYKDAHAVVEASEGIGGEVNAGTGKETMSFYIETPSEKLKEGLEWVSEVSLYPSFPKEPFERERDVVIEEARMFIDKHDRYSMFKSAHGLFGETVWGRPIEGYEKTINAIRHNDLRSFHDRNFSPANSVLVVAGNTKTEKVQEWAEKYFGNWSSTSSHNEQTLGKETDKLKPILHKPKEPFAEARKVKQVYLSIAFPGPKETDAHYYDYLIANAVLGMGMGSKLFKEVREKSGLCYYIFSSMAAYKRNGYSMIISGLNVDQLKKASIAIKHEIDLLIDGKITKDELMRAKLLTKTSVLSGFNDPLDTAANVADYFLSTGKVATAQETASEIDKVTVKSVTTVSNKLFDLSAASIAIVSPKRELASELAVLKV